MSLDLRPAYAVRLDGGSIEYVPYCGDCCRPLTECNHREG